MSAFDRTCPVGSGEQKGKLRLASLAQLFQEAFGVAAFFVSRNIQIEVLPIMLGKDDPVASHPFRVDAILIAAYHEMVREIFGPEVRLVAELARNLVDQLGKVVVAVAVEGPTDADVAHHMARCREMFVPEGMQRRLSELLGWLCYRRRALAFKACNLM
jgi:hypothetical protein